MKRCPKCRKRLPGTAFAKNASRKDGLSHTCKKCHRAYAKRHYQENRDYYRAKSRRYQREYTATAQGLVRERKAQPCADCGQSYPYYVMDLDHVRGTKRGEIARLVSNQVPLPRLVEEMDKCDVVCANCHRQRTHVRSQGPTTPRCILGVGV